MTVCIADSVNTDYNGTLSKANGMYRVEAHNLRGLGNALALTTTGTTIPVTFANAGSCLGVVIQIFTSAINPTTATVTTALQENVSGTWTTRVTKVLSYADITTGSPSYTTLAATYSNYIVPAVWATPYVVDTSTNKWRLLITASSNSIFLLATSDNTNPMFAVWCNNKVSFASNDVLIVKDPVTIDMDVTFRGVYGTGSTADSTCIVLCRNTVTTPADVCNLTVDTTAQRNITIDGIAYLSGYSGFRIGTDGSPVSITNRCIVTYQAYMTNGTNAISRWNCGFSLYRGKVSIYMYGEKPAVPFGTLAAEVAIGATSLLLNETPTGWSIGDKICIGKADAQGVSVSLTEYTISGITEKTITFSPAIATAKRVTGGHVVNHTLAYGVTWTVSNTAYEADHNLNMCNAAVFTGCKIINQAFRLNNQSSSTSPDLNSRCAKVAISHSLINARNAAIGRIFSIGHNHWMGTEVSNCVWLGATYVETFVPMQAHYNAGLGICTTDDNIIIGTPRYTLLPSGSGYTINTSFSRNVVENVTLYSFQAAFFGVNFYLDDNVFWGMLVNGATLGTGTQLRSPLDIAEWVGGSFKRNSFDRSHIPLQISGVMSGVDADGNSFGTEAANSNDLAFKEAAYVDTVWKNTRFAGDAFNLNLTELLLVQSNSSISLTNFNGTIDDLRSWFRRGRTYNVGETLRQISSRADEVFVNDYYISTKALAGYPFSIFITAQITGSGYYGGVYTLPTVSVLYNDTSSIVQTLLANTLEQKITLSATIGIDYSDIILRLSTATDSGIGVDFKSVLLKIRKYGKLFAEYELTIKQPTDSYIAGLMVPGDNLFITETDAAVVAAWTGVVVSKEIITISSSYNDTAVYDAGQYWATQNIGEEVPVATLDGVTITVTPKIFGVQHLVHTGKRLSGTIVLSSPGSYNMVLAVATLEFSTAGEYTIYESTLYETVTLINTSGGIVNVVVLPGTSLVNSGPNITVTEYIEPVLAHGTITGLVAGTRLQIYNVTTATEMVNTLQNSTEYAIAYTNGVGYTDGDIVRIRAIKVTGNTATIFIDTQTVAGSGGWSFLVAQVEDTVYNTNGVDGTTVTGVTIDDALLLVSVSTGTITWQDLYAYETAWLFTEEGIRDEGRFTKATDVANYTWYGFKIKNTSSPSTPLVISGGYGVDSETGQAIDLLDTTGGSVFLAPDHVVAKVVSVGGVNVITGDIADVPTAAEVATATRTELTAELEQISNVLATKTDVIVASQL